LQQFEIIKAFDQIKLLADKRRLAILRKLMAGPATLTQLGEAMQEHPAWIRHHVKQLELAGLVELVETRVTAGVVEKFYRARAGGMLLQELVLPDIPSIPSVIFSGSHDLAVELLAQKLAKKLNIMILPVGSLDGLVSLRQGLCHLSGCHLLDVNGEYNLPFIRHFFPDRTVLAFTLAHREQGLMTAPDNPKAIRSLTDLTRCDVTFINRNPGSGTRLWLDRQLQTQSLASEHIRGYKNTVNTHTECARLVQDGKTDVALGLHAAAFQHNLGFIPLFQERYDLIIPQEQMKLLQPLLNILQTRPFRRAVSGLIGYDTTHTGEQIPL
jgi:molybdate-binding protein/DNA-binding HxlR family transcriptional regulator